MDQPPPHRLEYQRAGPRRPRPNNKPRLPQPRNFFAGLGAGALVSLTIWFFNWDRFGQTGTAIWIVVICKFVASCVLLAFPKTYMFGMGMLLSIPIGALIFFGSCATHFRL